MHRFFALALLALPLVSVAQPVRLVNRTIDLGTYNFGSVKVLPNGNVAMASRAYQENSSRLYIFDRSGSVLAAHLLPDVRLSEMKVHESGRILLVGNWFNSVQNSYVGCYDQSGARVWSRTIDVAGGSETDGALDLDFTATGDVVVVGFIVATPTYGYCLSLNGQTGAQIFKIARADVTHARDIAIAPSGTIHITTNTEYWRLSSTGATLTRVSHPAGVTATEIAADKQSVYIVGLRVVSGRYHPWIQRRDALGVPIWAQYDPASTGAAATDINDTYPYLQIDASGYAHARGTLGANGIAYSRHARYSPAGALTLGISRPAYSGTGVVGRQFALDPYNEIYTMDSFYTQGDPSNQSELSRYAPYPLAVRWNGIIFDAPSGGGPGTPRSIDVHGPSGDVIVLQGLTDVPSRVQFQVWRQQAMPVEDLYVIGAAGTYASNRSVLTNDRYREGAALQLVTTTTKGTLSLNPATGHFTYTPNIGATGIDTFVYRLKKDGLVGTATKVTLDLF